MMFSLRLPEERTPFDSVFDIFKSDEAGRFNPQLDVLDTPTAFVVRTEVPGVNEKDIQISFQDGKLSIQGEKKSEHENPYWGERVYGKFARTLSFKNVKADAIDASFDKGVLSITIPKAESAKPKLIPIRTQ